MANPTTNYSFAMPTNTDLVKDLPADFEIFGQAVDTQMKTNADAAIAKTIVDAKGDLIAATAADTVARLAVGANGTVLTADSAEATGLKWSAPAAGGMTLLSTTTLSGASTTISSIDQTYVNLLVVISGANATSNYYLTIAPNGSTNICWQSGTQRSTTNTVVGQSANYILTGLFDNMGTGQTGNVFQMEIVNYASTTARKAYNTSSLYRTNTPTTVAENTGGGIDTTSAISSLVFAPTSGTFSAGTVLIYGVK